MKSDPKRKRRIIAAWKNGTPAVEIARSEVVSRQAVHMVIANYQKLGETFLSKRRGRTKVVPLTSSQESAVRNLLMDPDPGADGIPGVGWPETRIRGWFKSQFSRTITVHQIRAIRTESNLFLPKEYQVADDFPLPEYPPTPAKGSFTGQLADNDFPSLEEMKEALAQMRAQMRQEAVQSPAPPKKKKGLPFKKPKRKRR